MVKDLANQPQYDFEGNPMRRYMYWGNYKFIIYSLIRNMEWESENDNI